MPPKHKEIKVTVNNNGKVEVKPEKPMLKPGDTAIWTCSDECVVVFDGYNDNGQHGKKYHKGPLDSKTRILKAGKKVKVGKHFYTGPTKEDIPYKYTVIVCHDGKLFVEDPEIIVDPDPTPIRQRHR